MFRTAFGVVLSLFASVLFIGSALAQCPNPVSVEIPSITALPSDMILIPIKTQDDITDCEVEGFYFDVSLPCGDLLTPTGLNVGGTLIEDSALFLEDNITRSGDTWRVRIAWAGNGFKIVGSGTFVFIEATVDPAADCTDIGCEFSWNSSLLENLGGTVPSTTSAGNFQVPSASLNGTVYYGTSCNDKTVDGVRVLLSTPGFDHEEVTDQFGNFQQRLCNGVSYQLTAMKDRGEDADNSPMVISGTDASLILRYMVGLENLDACRLPVWCRSGAPFSGYPQRIAADVNGSGSITPLDASKILTYWLTQVLTDRIAEWDFFPINGYSGVANGNSNGFDFCSVLIGDVSGNWLPDLTMPMARRSAPITFAISQVKGEAWEGFTVPVNMGSIGLSSTAASLDFSYDATQMNLVDVRNGAAAEDALLLWNDDNGTVRVVLASTEEFDARGRLVELVFTAMEPTVDRVVLDLTDASLGEVPVVAHLADGAVYFEGGDAVEIDFGFELKSKGNPFNPNIQPSMSIDFSVPDVGPAALKIYSADGRLVRTLVDGVVPAGERSVRWDGRSDRGTRVSSGIYFTVLEHGPEKLKDRILVVR